MILALAVSGCASNPEMPKPSVPLSAAYQHGEDQPKGDLSADLPWWRQFDDERLVRLVERSALANHDIRMAVERARQARAGMAATESRLFPSLNVTASRSDIRTGLPAAVK